MSTRDEMYVPNKGVDTDGRCIICGYPVEWIAETTQPHECPRGFTQEDQERER